jgi:two-component system sensor histidine kinase VicK
MVANIIFVNTIYNKYIILTYLENCYRKFDIIRYLWVVLLLFSISSCNRLQDNRPGNTPEFKQIEARVDTLLGTNRAKQAIAYLDSAFALIDNPTVLDRYKSYGFRYYYQQKHVGDSKKALLYADTMLSIAKQNPHHPEYPAIYVDANFAQGDASFSLQRYNDAYQHLYQGYLVGRTKLKNKIVLSDYAYRLGMITYKMGNYQLAKHYFKKSYDDFDIQPKLFTSFYHTQELLDNIALSYKHLDQRDSAIIYFDRSLAFINKHAHLHNDRLREVEAARGVVYGNKAEIYLMAGDMKKAEDLLKKSISINLQKDFDNNDAILSEIKLAQIYDEQRRDTELFTLLDAINTQQKTINNPNVDADWNRLISNYYQRKGELRKSLDHLQTYITVRDSNLKKLNILKDSDIAKQIDSYEKQQQIEKLSNDNKIQIISLYVFAVMAVLTLAILFLIYRNWRRSTKDIKTVNLLNQQINQKNTELEGALNELKHSSQEKDRILRTVAHDLRNPLGGIASLTSLMSAEDLNEDQKELINLIKQTSYNSLELINEILEATNIGTIEINPEIVEINGLVNNSIELLRFKALEKGQKIFFEPLTESLKLTLSREKIWRVISNLISNAIKFSPTGAPINVKVVKDSAQVVISVQDNGIGIPEKMKDQIFNMFTAAQRPGTAGEKSFGLGLSICRQIMEKSGGKIWFYSRKQGTTFFISLPIKDQNQDATDLSEQVGIPQPR